MVEPTTFITSASEGLLYQPSLDRAPKLMYHGKHGSKEWRQHVLNDQPPTPTRTDDPQVLPQRDVQPIERCSICKRNACCIVRIAIVVILGGAIAFVLGYKPFSH